MFDVTGKLICPGFIDAHSHTDVTVEANPYFESTIRQGITTEVVGNCGDSTAPVPPGGGGGFAASAAARAARSVRWRSICDFWKAEACLQTWPGW